MVLVCKMVSGVGKLVSGGLVHRLIDLVRQRDSLEEEYKSKVVDMAISVLSNMCMEECTRNQVSMCLMVHINKDHNRGRSE